RRRVGQRVGSGDGRLHGEQAVVVIADNEIGRLTGLVGRPGRDGRRPAGDSLQAAVFEDGLITALGEARHVVDRVDGERNRGRGAVEGTVGVPVGAAVWAIVVGGRRVDDGGRVRVGVAAAAAGVADDAESAVAGLHDDAEGQLDRLGVRGAQGDGLGRVLV